MADQIESLIYHNGSKEKNEYGDNKYASYEGDTIQAFMLAVVKLREAFIFAQRIDWLICGDDDESTFHRRLRSDLEKLEKAERVVSGRPTLVR